MARRVKHKGALREIEALTYEAYGPGLTAVMWLTCGHRHRRAKWKMNRRDKSGKKIKRIQCRKCLEDAV